jgi:hypothetical protein
MASFVVRSLLSGAGIVLVAVACGDSFRSSFGDAGTGNGAMDASMNDSDGASSGGTSSGGASTGGLASDGGRSTSGGSSGSTSIIGTGGRGGASSGGATASTAGGRASMDGGNDAEASTGGTSATGGSSATGGTSGTGGSTGGAPGIPSEGLMLWLRADKGVTSNNSLVSRWADQSPLHLDAVQATARLQPLLLPQGINGHPALVFDGADDFLQITKAFDVETGGVTVFAVAQVTDAQSCSAFFEASNGEENNDIDLGPNNHKINWEILDSADETAGFDEAVPMVVSGTVGPDDKGSVMTNGVVAVTLNDFIAPVKVARLQTFIGKTLYGACQTFPGRIGEVIVYNRALSLEETLGVQRYLGAEFGCCLN